MRRILLGAALLLTLSAEAQRGPVATSLAQLAALPSDDDGAVLEIESPTCGCCPGVARPAACVGTRPSRRSLEAIGIASGAAWGAGLGLSSQHGAKQELGPFRPVDAGLTIASAVTAAVLHGRKRSCQSPIAAPPHGLDGWARRAFKAETLCGEDAANDYSYITAPASFAAPLAFVATTHDPASDRDALVLLEANMITTALIQVGKHVAPRRRPYAEFCEPTPRTNLCNADANESFFSGHAAQSFASAVAAGTIASMRGQKRAPWVWATGLSVATTTSYFRMRSDRHHLSDVLVGIGIGSLIGWAVPHFHRTRDLEPQPGAAFQPPPPQLSFTVHF